MINVYYFWHLDERSPFIWSTINANQKERSCDILFLITILIVELSASLTIDFFSNLKSSRTTRRWTTLMMFDTMYSFKESTIRAIGFESARKGSSSFVDS
jgi:hypothetical protein